MSATVVVGVFVWLVGLAVGSFLNVVAHRLPRGGSIGRPRRSYCPACEAPIAWYDNLPVLSWLLLAARCRTCRAPISVQYPLVEAATGLAFVLVYHLLFVDPSRAGVEFPTLPRDLPLLLAWLTLAAALVACCAMDIVSYLIDTRVTDCAVIAGLILHALWPRPEHFVPLAQSPLAAACVAAFVVSALLMWRAARREAAADEDAPHSDAENDQPPVQVESHFEPADDTTPINPAQSTSSTTATSPATPQNPPPEPAAPPRPMPFAAGALSALLLVAVAAAILYVATVDAGGLHRVVVPAALLALFALIVLAAGQPRAADAELHEAIEQEQPRARRLALSELLWLAAPLAAGAAAWLATSLWPAGAAAWSGVAGWTTATGFAPLGGLAYAATGAILAAAAGWLIRIVFTLALGREAFGIGDIFILGAVGACAGWDIALLGFLLAVPIALAGWMLSLFIKRHGMVPFGPPLALGFAAALWLSRPATEVAGWYAAAVHSSYEQRPDLLLLGVGMLLAAGAGSLIAARMVRRLVMGADTGSRPQGTGDN